MIPPLKAQHESARKEILQMFEESVQVLYVYFLYCTFNQSLAHDLTVNLYATALRQRRTFWWRQDLLTAPYILKLARKMVRRVSRWKIRSSARQPVDDSILHRNLQSSHATRQALVLHQTIAGLPREQRELAVLGVLSGWPRDKVAELFGDDAEEIAVRISDLEQQIFAAVAPGRHGLSSSASKQLIQSLMQCLMPDEEIERTRYALMAELDRIGPMPLRSIAFASVVLLLPLALLSASAFIPFALEEEIREVAAIEVLLSDEVMEYDRALASIEDSLEGMGASIALEDVEKITLELAAYAMVEHSDDREELDAILNRLGTKLLPEGESQTAFSLPEEGILW